MINARLIQSKLEPLLILKINNKKPLAIVDAEYFIHQQSINKSWINN